MPYGCNAGPFLGIGMGSGPENCNTDHTVEMFTADALLARKHQRGLLCVDGPPSLTPSVVMCYNDSVGKVERGNGN